MERRTFLSTALLTGAAVLSTSILPAYAAENTVKVGVLHSLSGTMAISETCSFSLSMKSTSREV
jgi:urea transport system substrate-binding protein